MLVGLVRHLFTNERVEDAIKRRYSETDIP